MAAVIDMLERQRALEHQYAEFLDSLHLERTVTLADLVSDPNTPTRLGIEDWFDQDLFRKRVSACWVWLSSIEYFDIPRNLALIFFQSSVSSEDWDFHKELCDTHGEHYAGRTLPAEHRYIHTRTSFAPKTLGDWKSAGRIIQPLGSFSSFCGMDLFRDTALMHQPMCGKVIGYRIPDYPALLNVSGSVATDYLARMVVHDLGHGWLPSIYADEEPLHDVAMIDAMSAQPFAQYSSPWERVVHAECTDPFFFLDGYRHLGAIDASSLSPLAQVLHGDLLRHFFKLASAQSRMKLWDLPSKRKGERARRHVRDTIDAMREDGFRRYAS